MDIQRLGMAFLGGYFKEIMMKNFLSSVANFIREEDGATAVEYGILVAAIAAAIIIIVLLVGAAVRNAFQTICNKMTNTACSVT